MGVIAGLSRVRRVSRLAVAGPRAEQELFQIRCDRGAAIALDLGLSRETAEAIRGMDEPWDGGGQPAGLSGDGIPLLAQIVGIAQVAEIFWQQAGTRSAIEVLERRSGRWFSPTLVRAARAVGGNEQFWRDLQATDPVELLRAVAPEPALVVADATPTTIPIVSPDTPSRPVRGLASRRNGSHGCAARPCCTTSGSSACPTVFSTNLAR